MEPVDACTVHQSRESPSSYSNRIPNWRKAKNDLKRISQLQV